ncbi:flagellar biosynthetic protein FliO [Parachlamydia sp. AcF125]|uniref:FliO/MopB family protein n=1 Tax=Parachlamydia sp. AcF125 TaxID=2795736 RepID=UPI001BC9E221|nr:flagellar biosynthetic protein FliO [Parachlamydia sp. AcF125]MBS4168867.1 hypothetical protein [Parachlamydia sp. AcF125]
MRLSTLLFIFFCLLSPTSSWSGEVSDGGAKSSSSVGPLSSALHKKTDAVLLDEAFQQELKAIANENSPFWKNFIYMVFVLGLIVSALLFLSWAVKKIVYTRFLQDNVTSMIKILDRRSLSPKSWVYVVEIEGKQLILGESLNGLTKLAEKNLVADFSIADQETQESFRQLFEKKNKE